MILRRGKQQSKETPLFSWFQNGLCSSSELETSRGSIRIQHLTAAATANPAGGPNLGPGGISGNHGLSGGSEINGQTTRFPRLEECAHFHYEYTDIGPISVRRHTIPIRIYCHFTCFFLSDRALVRGRRAEVVGDEKWIRNRKWEIPAVVLCSCDIFGKELGYPAKLWELRVSRPLVAPVHFWPEILTVASNTSRRKYCAQ